MAQIKFGTSGWRAIIADSFTFENVRLVTQAISDHLYHEGVAKQGIIVGYDTRFLSRSFALEATKVLTGNGISVWLCNRDTPTPVISMEILRRKTGGAINFTASHNPPEYNGIKFSPAWGGPALPETTQDIERRANAYLKDSTGLKWGDLEEARQAGRLTDLDPQAAYLEDLRTKVDFDIIRHANLKILVNPIFGTGRGYLDTALEAAGCRIERMNDYPDPTFGGISPEPSEEELKPMMKRIAAEGFDLGLSTDGDADRFGIIDRGGHFIEPNSFLALLANELIETRGWKEGIARSVATTHFIDAVAKCHSVPIYETPVGFKFIGELIAAGKVFLGGEESAGLSIRGHVPEKDGILACLLAAEIVARHQCSLHSCLSDLYQRVGYRVTRRINFRLSERQKKNLLQKLDGEITHFAHKKVIEQNAMDGKKLFLEDGAWVLFRLSGTEPVVRYYIEAGSEQTLDDLTKAGYQYIE